MLLYHGSNMVVDEPKLVKQTRGLDFGPGFYLTTNEEQAWERAEYVSYRLKTGISTVSIFDYDAVKADNTLDIEVFNNPDAQWLEFVRANRLKLYKGKQYDVITGPTANDRVYATLISFDTGFFDVETALKTLKPFKLDVQYCFATEKALKMLKFDGYNTKEKED